MTETTDCTCKVGRVTDQYELDGVDEWLVADWQSGTSVRDLTTAFNEDLVESHLASADVSLLEWDPGRVLDALGGDDGDSETIEGRRALERAGVDVEALEADLVSHQTIYRHLTNCLDASVDADLDADERRENARETVFALQRRTELVTNSRLDGLQAAGVTELGDPDAIVDVQVVCRDCGQSMPFERALTTPCHCHSD
jgi:hypothetical protein